MWIVNSVKTPKTGDMESKFAAGCCLIVFLVIGCCCISVNATPNGAPEEACATMIPNHGVDWQYEMCPFEIIVEKVNFIVDILIYLLFCRFITHFYWIRILILRRPYTRVKV